MQLVAWEKTKSLNSCVSTKNTAEHSTEVHCNIVMQLRFLVILWRDHMFYHWR